MALQELGSDEIGEAYVTATVTVWDEDAGTANEKLRLVEKVIEGRDFTCIPETVNAIEAWLGSLPGHVYANVRQPPVSTLNLALRRVAAGMAGVAKAGAGAAAQISRRSASDGPPDWAQCMRRDQTLSHGLSTAAHAVRSGEHGGGSSSVSLHQDDH